MKAQTKRFKELITSRLDCLPLILLHGTNTIEITEKCQEAIEIICGPNAKLEMRVNKISETTILKTPENLREGIKTASFFPGKQTLVIESVTEKITKLLSEELKDWTELDATIILVAKSLKVNSSLRKLVDPDSKFLSFAFYEQLLSSDEVEQIINNSKLVIIEPKVVDFLKDQNNFSSPGAFKRLIETLALFKYNDPSPVTFADIENFVTESLDPNEIEMCNCLATGSVEKMLLVLRNLFNKGVKPSQIINSTSRHFNLLFQISMNIPQMDEILNSSFPPLFGHRRNQVVSQSRIWTATKLERAIFLIFEADKDIRSSSNISSEAVVERCFLRVATLIKRIH